ncbi:integral membrane protein MviN [Ameyamaea chiangmaiensis NBRC 103196]|uniref:Probable lipid II flippase MurJ n=1 Tax=Ameyamaea chiangmaiensis TaxID=442969 RepID=A0A850PJE0_9PROT|nr:murein biosynthesis integral membrane protein MurJ [Ameyamaea chiangmaiensis]MBS4073875.1 murein biosynthesis integral membrane protein MurJ [Ameyamaea chiangmaiensis]NVN41401.1 murein biosynthesis integral membrane protein MurJ [Ameyamaea chiangmaiensis]GBQ68096.1 integral membrane protein MviN [Ameyamaea chiangmaiensis NBRC 103196]
MLRSFLTVGGWTMLSRVLGLVRDQLLAAFMGAGPLQDAYQVAFRLPNMFRRLFGEGAFNAAFVPQFSAILTTEGPDTARRFAREALGVLVFWLLALTALGEVFMPAIVSVIAPGFGLHGGGERHDLAVSLSRITFPYLVLICAAALVSGVLNGMGRFSAAAAAYATFNVVGIAAILWLAPFTATVAHAAAWGITASGVVQLGLLLVAARRAGMELALPRPRLTPQIRTLMRRMVPGLVGSGISQINLVVDTIIATLLPTGSVSLMYFADRVNQLPLGVLGAAAGTTLLPELTRHVAAGDTRAAHETQSRALEYALILTLPATLALIVLARPIMATLFGHGAFSARDAALSAQSLQAYAIGLPAFVLVKVLSPGFFARGDTATPVRVGIATLVLNFALNLSLYRPLAHVGPPLASSLAACANAAALGWLLRRRAALALSPGCAGRLARMIAASFVMTAMLALAQMTPLGHVADWTTLPRVIGMAALVCLGTAVYGAALQALGVADSRAIMRRLATRLNRR